MSLWLQPDYQTASTNTTHARFRSVSPEDVLSKKFQWGLCENRACRHFYAKYSLTYSWHVSSSSMCFWNKRRLSVAAVLTDYATQNTMKKKTTVRAAQRPQCLTHKHSAELRHFRLPAGSSRKLCTTLAYQNQHVLSLQERSVQRSIFQVSSFFSWFGTLKNPLEAMWPV